MARDYGPHGGSSRGRSSGPGPGGQGARGQATQNPGRSAPSGPGPDRHPPAPTPAHTVAPTAQYDDRILRIADQNKRTSALRNRAGGEGFHQFLTPRTNYQKPTLGMRMGALGRGLGNIFKFVNPLTLMSGGLNLMGKQGLGYLLSGLNLGYRNNLFNRNINQEDDEEEISIEDIIGRRAGQDYRFPKEGLESLDVYPENRPLRDGMFTDQNLMAANYSQNAVANQMLGTNYDVLDPFQQQQIDDAINTYGTTSLGHIKT